jgi:hypothetical protein
MARQPIASEVLLGQRLSLESRSPLAGRGLTLAQLIENNQPAKIR